MQRERRIRTVVYACSAVIVALLASNMAHCRDPLRIIWDRGHSHPGMLARFYFVVIMGVIVIVTQNVFIRKALARIERRGDLSKKEDA